MSESPTDGGQAQTASQEPTVTEQVQIPAAEQNQETSSQAVPQGAQAETVSEANPVETPTQTDEGAKQTQKQDDGSAKTDDGLAKFAKSQGFDPENLTDSERRALKIAHDNQKAYRSKTVAQSKADVDGDVTRDEIEEFKREFRTYQAQKQAEQFFAQEGRDDSLAPVMSEILEEKKNQHGADYARVLSQDLNLLYDLARVRQGSLTGPQVDAEAIRREERESINKKLSSSTPSAHATTGSAQSNPVVTEEWIRTQYDSRNPEHVKLVDAYFGR